MSTQPTLDPSATISEAFSIYKDHAGVLIPAALGVYVIQAIGAIAFAGSALGSLLILVLGLVLGTIFTGAVVQLVRDVQDGHLDSSVGQLVAAVTPVIVPLILVSLLSGILIGIGFILIIVPGLFLMTLFAVVAPVTVLEKPGVLAALTRSRELVNGSGWAVFGVIVFIIVLGIVIGILASVIGSGSADWVRAIIQWIASAIVAPISSLATAVMYLRLRAIKGEAPVASGVAAPPA